MNFGNQDSLRKILKLKKFDYAHGSFDCKGSFDLNFSLNTPYPVDALGQIILPFLPHASCEECLFNDQHLAAHISGEIDTLRGAVIELNVLVPEEDLKAGLGIHYELHRGLPSLTAESIIRYFDMHYMLRIS